MTRGPDMPDRAPPRQDASIMLGICSEVFSKWYLVMRGYIQRERVRQTLFREEHGLPRHSKVPYIRQPLTAQEAALSLAYESMVRTVLGDGMADYARDKFMHAVDTGDMRAFKIRLLFLKARDSLAGSPLHKDFLDGVELFIEKAELIAGCKPDPSPRRLSHAEMQRKIERDRIRDKRKAEQQELGLMWPGESPEPGLTQDIENPRDEGFPKQTLRGKTDKKSGHRDTDKGVTVTVKKGVTVTPGSTPRVIRKAREYENTDQILEDIVEGRVTPYSSTDEICDDLKSGAISALEAFMFTSALERYDSKSSEDALEQELERECEEALESDDDIDYDEVEMEGDEGDEPQEPKERTTPCVSYNPNGFGGCRGVYSGSGAEWNTDDDW